MKKKFSLNAFLHNDRLLMLFSAIAAIVIWALVSFGPGNTQSRTISVTQTIDLTGTIAGYNDLRVIGEDTFTVSVTVEGARSVIFNLSAQDIDIRPSLSDIQGAGVSEVSLTATKVKSGAYTITSISPSVISLNCDYWLTTSVPLTVDVSKVAVKDEKAQQIGDVRIDSSEIANGTIQMEGPQTTVKRITSVVATVDEGGTIDATTRYSAKLIAYDAEEKEVDLSNCRFTGASADNTLDITVPIWVQKKVPLSYTLLNKPEGIAENGLITLTPSEITLVGEAQALEAAATTIGNLGTIDFDQLLPENAEATRTLNIPSDIRVLEGDTVSLRLAIGNYTTKTLSYPVKDLSDVTVINLPEGKNLKLQSQQLSNIVLCGPRAVLNRIKASDLKVTLDAASNNGTGSVRYTVRITVPSQNTVWVYYGDGEASAYRLYGTLE
ncbi:MAG: hypothetical protein IJP14_05285 [Clostridia bacterium]|nr:hypothetical protein [Clostridia bacterium]